ncbi:MAG TPA: SUMF1/EgtB/PvdO family nonheme iron enzyme [Sphingomonas sp.]
MKVIVGLTLLATLALPQGKPKPFRDRPAAPEMVVIPAGRGVEGSTEAETMREGRAPALAAFERPRRAVSIAQPFAMATHHVTNREFGAFVKATRRDMAGCVVLAAGKWSSAPDRAHGFADPGWATRDDQPVVCVNWDDADAYAAWLSARTGKRYRLPTEREYEYAARAGTTTARWWGDGADDLCSRANGGDRSYAAILPSDAGANLACDDGYATVNPVGRYPANRWGLHDMYGNAWQWTADCFAATRDTPAPDPCPARAIRGGSWHSSAATLRSATRFSLPPATRASSLGFRVVREIDDIEGERR